MSWRRVRAALRQQGLIVNHKKIRRLMRQHDLQPKTRRRFIATTDSNHDQPIFPNLAAEVVPQPRRDFGHALVEETPGVKLGQSVVHAKFGSGVVTDIEGAGAHARVQVNFDEAGSKWLVMAYANLQPA